MAIHDGLRWGDDIVFTYGPLGFMNGRAVWFGDLGAIAFVYGASLYVGFCIALVWALRRSITALPAVALAFFIVTVLPLIEESIVLGALSAMRALAHERSERVVWTLVVGGATFAAIEVLIKFSAGPVIAAFFLIALIGLRASWLQLAAYLGLLAAEMLALWLITGQSLGEIPDFLRNTYEIVSGFSAAMIASPDVAGWKVTAATAAAIAVMLGLVAASSRGDYRDARARWAGVALTALAAFTMFKEGVVRTDAGHLSLLFSTACILWIAIPWTRARWYWLAGRGSGDRRDRLAGAPGRPDEQHSTSVANVKQAVEQVRNLASPARRQRLIDDGRGAMQATYQLEPAALAALRGHTVAIEPWEIGAAWAYDLDWQPLPVFQNYSAYTARLDRINSEAAASPEGPERILRENTGLVYPEFPTRDDRQPLPGLGPARTSAHGALPLRRGRGLGALAGVGAGAGPLRPLAAARRGRGEPGRGGRGAGAGSERGRLGADRGRRSGRAGADHRLPRPRAYPPRGARRRPQLPPDRRDRGRRPDAAQQPRDRRQGRLRPDPAGAHARRHRRRRRPALRVLRHAGRARCRPRWGRPRRLSRRPVGAGAGRRAGRRRPPRDAGPS